MSETQPQRFIGLDIHKHYCVATGVNADLEQVFGPQRIANSKMASWAKKHLTPYDAIVLEMTTNTYKVHDMLVDQVHSVTVVHPPHVALIARAKVKTDKKDSLVLARLHAGGLLPAVWIPPQDVRDQRTLVAERWKMVRLRATAKNRLHSILHRFQIVPPGQGYLFAQKKRDWWDNLPLPETEKTIVKSYLATLDFAQQQVELFESRLKELAAADARMPLLAQLPGISLITGMTLLAAIGTIERFPSAKHLVGYAGLGSSVDQSGTKYRTGRITKTGRKDLRHAMVEAARIAAQSHPKWQAEYDRLSPRIGRNKAIVAIARKLLEAVWHILTKREADRFADPRRVALTLYNLGYKLGTANLPEKNVRQFVRNRLDDLGIGADLEHFPYGKKKFVTLPPSRLSDWDKKQI